MDVDSTDSKASTGSTSPVRHALLIASPWHDLKGPVKDLDAMAELLGRHGFEIRQLRDAKATREKIIDEWESLISRLGRHDAVVVYYSGHGGFLEEISTTGTPNRYQFLVPMDYDADSAQGFRGILDVEISVLVRRMTEKTQNVTIIMDCCHSGRMARDPRHGDSGVPKNVTPRRVDDLAKHVDGIKKDLMINLHGRTKPEGNPYAVRIVAAADNEKAYEFDDDQGKRRGALTKALIPSLDEALSAIAARPVKTSEDGSDQREYFTVTWESVMLRVRQLVNIEFPDQHPQVEGPHRRVIFLQEEVKSQAPFLVVQEDEDMILQGGIVANVREHDIYVIRSSDHNNARLGEARVTYVNGFRAELRPTPYFRIPDEGALAYIKTQGLPRSPVEISKDLQENEHVAASKFIRPATDSDAGMNIARIIKKGNTITVYDGPGTKLWSSEFDSRTEDFSMQNAVEKAENLSRANHLHSLEPSAEELLHCTLETTVSVVGHEDTPLADNKSRTINAEDKVIIALRNGGKAEIFVSVFDVNVAGKVTHLSKGAPDGIRMPAQSRFKLGQRQHDGVLGDDPKNAPGLKTSWPRHLPADAGNEVPESYIFVVSDCRVDVRYFANLGRDGPPQEDVSQLQWLAYHLACGSGRDTEAERVIQHVKWAIVRFPFTLVKKIDGGVDETHTV